MVVVAVGWFERGWCCSVVGGACCLRGGSKQRQVKKNGYLKESQPDESRIIPFNNGGDLSEHRLTGITELGTLMVVCEFPQP